MIWLFRPRADMGHVKCDTGDMDFGYFKSDVVLKVMPVSHM